MNNQYRCSRDHGHSAAPRTGQETASPDSSRQTRLWRVGISHIVQVGCRPYHVEGVVALGVCVRTACTTDTQTFRHRDSAGAPLQGRAPGTSRHVHSQKLHCSSASKACMASTNSPVGSIDKRSKIPAAPPRPGTPRRGCPAPQRAGSRKNRLLASTRRAAEGDVDIGRPRTLGDEFACVFLWVRGIVSLFLFSYIFSWT